MKKSIQTVFGLCFVIFTVFFIFTLHNGHVDEKLPNVEAKSVANSLITLNSLAEHGNFIAGFEGEDIDWYQLWDLYKHKGRRVVMICKIKSENTYDSFYLTFGKHDFGHSHMFYSCLEEFRFDLGELFDKMPSYNPNSDEEIVVFGKNGAFVQLVDWSILVVNDKKDN